MQDKLKKNRQILQMGPLPLSPPPKKKGLKKKSVTKIRRRATPVVCAEQEEKGTELAVPKGEKS